MSWMNPSGIVVRNGRDWIAQKSRGNRGGTLSTMGAVKQIEIDVDAKRLPAGAVNYTTDRGNTGTATGFYTGDVSIPAYANIVSAELVVGETFLGGTTLDVGLFELDGSAIDADGLIAAAAVADLTIGERIVGAGAVIGETVGSEQAYIGLTATGTFTAGKGRLIIKYIDPVPTPGSY